ncbi:hypothetical protein N7456_002666 [Penicillium angulare]|uniref:DUF7702 domain-containing protein n=1 Tax=Penicillium angulare TaxID=116970 RepID=A0A9W9G8V2_9EURO|nr:hypothetical protein N7456_002666 [Penicillium angulare]
MLANHSKLSIAQIVFYLPVLAISSYFACHRHQRPRMAWIILAIFSIGEYKYPAVPTGILVIIYEQLFNNYFVLISDRLVLEQNASSRIHRCLVFSRILFFAGMALVIAGGGLEGSDNTNTALTGIKLVKAGYIIVVIFAACLLAIQVHFWKEYSRISGTSQTILRAMALATPFIVVRITYLFLSVFQASDLRWNALAGPIAPFLTMGLLMEYIVVWIYLTTGFIIPRYRAVKGRDSIRSCTTLRESV